MPTFEREDRSAFASKVFDDQIIDAADPDTDILESLHLCGPSSMWLHSLLIPIDT